MYLKIRIFADSNIKPHLKKAISLAEIYCENKNSFTAYNSTLFKTSKKVEKLVVAYSLYPSNSTQGLRIEKIFNNFDKNLLYLVGSLVTLLAY